MAQAYHEVSHDSKNMTITTGSAAIGALPSEYAASQIYYVSFLQRAIRSTRGTNKETELTQHQAGTREGSRAGALQTNI